MSGGLEQLLYGSVDVVTDGVESSGWQVKAKTDGIAESRARELIQLIEPRLMPLRPLPGFPTEEEIERADRRLVHRGARHGSGAVLLHTAPAGQDTTGRPNTMTHVVVDGSDDTARPLLGPSTWRAAWWSTPFGSEQMREAELPAAATIGPGETVTADSGLAVILEPGAGEVLTALADVVAQNEMRSDALAGQLAVLVVDSADQAAQWLGALLRATAPEPARALTWSTLERVNGENDLENLRDGGFDIVAVPRHDLESLMRVPDRCIIVDASHPPQGIALTSFGALVQAMASDVGTWMAAQEAIDSWVLRGLFAQHGVTLAWPAAMAQALAWRERTDPSEPVLLDTAFGADLHHVVESVLLGTHVPATDASPEQSDAMASLLGPPQGRSAQAWVDLSRRLEASAPDKVFEEIAVSYLQAAVKDPSWLMREPSGSSTLSTPPTRLREMLSSWSLRPEKLVDASKWVREAEATCRNAFGEPGDDIHRMASENVRLVAALQSDGLVVPPEILRHLIRPLGDILVADVTDTPTGDGRRQGARPDSLLSSLSADARRPVAEMVDEGLRVAVAADGRGMPVPSLSSAVTERLTEGVLTADLPFVDVERAAVSLHRGNAGPLLAALQQVPGERIELSVKALEAVEETADAGSLELLDAIALPPSQCRRIARSVALRYPEDPRSRRTLAQLRRESEDVRLRSVQEVEAKTLDSAEVQLAEALAENFFDPTVEQETAWRRAENALHASVRVIEVLDHAELERRQSAHRRADAVARRAVAALVVLAAAHPSPQRSVRDSRRFHAVQSVVAKSEPGEAPGALIAPQGGPVEPVFRSALLALVAGSAVQPERSGRSRTDSAPPPLQMEQRVDAFAGAAHHPRQQSKPLGAPSAQAVAAVLDARVRQADPEHREAWVRDVKTCLRSTDGWDRARELLPALAESSENRVERIGRLVRTNRSTSRKQRKDGRNG